MLWNSPVVKMLHLYRERSNCAHWVAKQVRASGQVLELVKKKKLGATVRTHTHIIRGSYSVNT